MNLLTTELKARLTANAEARLEAQKANPLSPDPFPVLKYFNPLGPATWLATELYPDGDTLFGLADLGFGFPELGCFSFEEIASIRLPAGLGIERDLYFHARFPISVYAEAARSAERITEDAVDLRDAAQRLGLPPDHPISPLSGE